MCFQVEDGQGEQYLSRIRTVIKTIATQPLDPCVDSNTGHVNMWQHCPFTRIALNEVAHKRSQLCLLTLLNSTAAVPLGENGE